jgi:transposase-like protein
MAGKPGMRHYSAELKQQAVVLFLEEGLSYREIAQRLQIRQAARIEVWVRDFRREGRLGLCKPQGRPRRALQPDLARLQMENTLLRKWHSELRTIMRAKRNIG